MSMETCSLVGVAFQCFQLNSSAPKFFGFSEFISCLALMLLVWTIVDARYKFRIATATLPLKSLALLVTTGVGVLTLLTDLWRAKEGWVPAGHLLTPESWQFFLGAAFLTILFAWLWSAFIRPATFSSWNAMRFVKVLDASIMRGSPTELLIVADELSRSAGEIIQHATNSTTTEPSEIGETEALADRLLHMMGSPKFCRATVEGAPGLIYNVFRAISQRGKYRVCIEIFTKNIVNAAIENRTSFLYSETDYYESGLEGVTKRITSVLFQDPGIVNNIGTLLSPSYSRRAPWDIEQWRAYFRLVLPAFSSHISSKATTQTAALSRSRLTITSIFADLNEELQLTRLNIHDDLYLRMTAIGDLIKDMVTCLDKCGSEGLPIQQHATDYIVELIRSLIKAASSVRKPQNVAIRIQRELIWMDILNSPELRTRTGRSIQHEVHSWLEDTLRKRPNLDSVRLLGYCLNVLGFHPSEEDELYGASWREFHLRFLDWVKENLATLLLRYPSMERESFVEGMYYDREYHRLVFKDTPVGQCCTFNVKPHCEIDSDAR